MSRVLATAGLALVLLLFAAPASAGTLPHATPGCTPLGVDFTATAQVHPWAQQALDYSGAWKFTEGRGVKVAVIDSGVDASSQFGNRVQVGKTFANAPSGPADGDCVGHGTMMAGIIGAAPAPGTAFAGVAPQATIESIKIANSQHSDISTATIAQAVAQAINSGARVIDMSLATPDDDPSLRSVIEYAIQRRIVVVAGAGNDIPAQNGQPAQQGPFYPASYPGVLSVGAVNSTGALASFSDRHSDADVTAPGEDVTSTFPGSGGDIYQAGDGTSFAAPFVSGLAALVIARYPGLTAAQVVQRIEDTADGSIGTGSGNGLINPVQAVTAVRPASGAVAASSAQQSAVLPGARKASRNWPGIIAAMGIVAGVFAALVLLIVALLVISARLGRRHRPDRRRTAPRLTLTSALLAVLATLVLVGHFRIRNISRRLGPLLTPLSSLLVALVVAGVFAILRILSPGNATGLDNPGTLVTDSSTGTLYVPCYSNELCPVVNKTSALLALRISSPKRVAANDGAIARHKIGPELGLGVPPVPPDETSLIKGPWSVCTRPASSSSRAYTSSVLVGGRSVGGRPAPPAIVSAQPGTYWLLLNGERYPLSHQQAHMNRPVTSVPNAWLDAIPEAPVHLRSVGIQSQMLAPATLCATDTVSSQNPRITIGATVPTSAIKMHGGPQSSIGVNEVWLPPGKSALVALAPGTDQSADMGWSLVTDGARYALAGSATAGILDYHLARDEAALPASWLWLVPQGPALDPTDAASPYRPGHASS